MVNPVTSYNRVPPPFDPESRDSHLDGELGRLEQSTASIIARLGTVGADLATAVSTLEIADATITSNYIAADVVVTAAYIAADAAEVTARDAAIAAAIAAISNTITETSGGLIAVPTNKSYIVALKVPYACTITETTVVCASGTATATFKINATALGGAAHAVSSTEQSITRSSANVLAANDDVVVEISANATCMDLAFSFKTTRTIT